MQLPPKMWISARFPWRASFSPTNRSPRISVDSSSSSGTAEEVLGDEHPTAPECGRAFGQVADAYGRQGGRDPPGRQEPRWRTHPGRDLSLLMEGQVFHE